METEDIRWKQRFSNYLKALNKLQEAITLQKDEWAHFTSTALSEIVKEGVIQRFEYTHELAWNLLRDYAIFQGNNEIRGSRDATKWAFKNELIKDGELWMDMILSRNQTSHNYNQEVSNEIFEKISNQYLPSFVGLKLVFEKLSISSTS